jgi:hypothetical protein
MPDRDVIGRVLPLLGWEGFTVVEARAWSTARLVVCVLDDREHERRAANGELPVIDPLLLQCIGAERPEFMLARPPVRIAGAIAVRGTWKSAVRNLAGFGAFGARLAVLPPEQADRLDVAAGAAVEGYGVVAADDDGVVRLAHYPDVRPREGGRTWIHRLVEEIVYDALLTSGEGELAFTASTATTSSADTPVVPSRPAGPV